ncbi:MAG: CtsR family transcriptional regulator [Anaeromicrobium sp.]|jgi:transcriptional regulator CtsR|uniref:CtsR family transcriptional regulator n=1 Tax=Anaeromicrobium sp. TaxID=1929132 RepID=UPI0025D085C9|nr:CtsR family transcriptional regulator [Anaeromicrobium sp.]MCT4595386.1 CtsR family transcriptional regulator [Anaeromicrobium sp.]
MARISDIIEIFIKELLEDANDREIEIQRNELANYFKCAPSQINYVLTTRFSLDKGYIVEGRRGGGGHIKIVQTNMDKENFIKLILHEIGNAISAMKAKSVIGVLKDKKFITDREAQIMISAISDRSLITSTNIKDEVRANIMKGMILSLVNFNGR